MYHKLRNTLAGLGVVLAMFTSGVLFSDPLPAKATATPVSAEAQLTTLTLAVLQTVIAVGTGGLWGTGYASGMQAQGGWLVVPFTDNIFAIVAEELGFVGALAFLALLVFIPLGWI